MRTRWKIGVLVLAISAIGPAAAQANQLTGIPTETQRRLAKGETPVPWGDLIGLVGLVGLLGLRKRHPEDGYHPSPIE